MLSLPKPSLIYSILKCSAIFTCQLTSINFLIYLSWPRYMTSKQLKTDKRLCNYFNFSIHSFKKLTFLWNGTIKLFSNSFSDCLVISESKNGPHSRNTYPLLHENITSTVKVTDGANIIIREKMESARSKYSARVRSSLSCYYIVHLINFPTPFLHVNAIYAVLVV